MDNDQVIASQMRDHHIFILAATDLNILNSKTDSNAVSECALLKRVVQRACSSARVADINCSMYFAIY